MTVQAVRTRRDRWADWAVAGLVVLALLLGWAVMAAAEGGQQAYADADSGLQLRYPREWLVQSEEGYLFRAVDPRSGQWPTVYEVRAWPADPAAPLTSTLTMALNNVSLSRAQQGTAYHLFDMTAGDEIKGQPSMEARYVYVAVGDDLFVEHMPAVMLGRDVAVAYGGQTVVFSLVAPEDSFDEAEAGFRALIESAELP